mmetsp:Transcript_9059/g.20931  ORF Transcript_9059/g.20931 Transcript_9059/m.20931 type:complete len:120 (+) Transcript_9059:963-1322(+)
MELLPNPSCEMFQVRTRAALHPDTDRLMHVPVQIPVLVAHIASYRIASHRIASHCKNSAKGENVVAIFAVLYDSLWNWKNGKQSITRATPTYTEKVAEIVFIVGPSFPLSPPRWSLQWP